MINTIPADLKTPQIIIDEDSAKISVSGKIIPENPHDYFKSINPLIHKCFEKNNKITLEFDLEYFNTGAAKYLYELLKSFKDKENVKIIWYYEEDDEDILESGQEFESLTGLDFEIKVKA